MKQLLDKNITKTYFQLLLVFILWGSLYVVSKLLMGEMPIFTVSFLRFFIAWIFLTAVSRGMKTEETGKKKPDSSCRKYILILGLVGYTVSVGLQLVGTKLAGSSTASLINSLNPVTIMLMAALILKEPLTRNKITGIILSIVGVYMIIGMNSAINLPGAFISILAVLGWSWTSVMIRKGISGYDPLLVTCHAMGIAAVCSFVLCIGEILLYKPRFSIHSGTVIGLLYMGIGCTGIAHILWNKCLTVLPAGTCSSFYPIQPLVSTLLGIIFLREKIDIWFLMGAILIVSGVLISLRQKYDKACNVFVRKNK